MKALFFINILFIASILTGKDLNESDLLRTFFEKRIFKEKNEYIIGEVEQYQKDYDHIGASLPENCTFEYSVTDTGKGYNVWKIKIFFDTLENDYYVKIQFDNGKPKIAAIRAMFIPQMFELAADSILKSKTATDEERYQAECIQMWYSGDKKLISFFRDKKAEFQKVLSIIHNETKWNRIRTGDTNGILISNQTFKEKCLHSLLRTCRLNLIYKKPEYPNLIFFNLGGFLDNEVGYFIKVRDGELPRPFMNDFIHIEEIDGEWYLYKTT